MRAWQEDQLHALLAVDCEAKLFEALVAFARDLGFDHCAYGLRMPVPLTCPKTAMYSNYPYAWQTQYLEGNYVVTDPTVHHCLRSPLPVVWSDALFTPVPAFWENARSFGLRFGWAQSSRDMRGVGGMLTLARSSEPIQEAELQDKGLKMAWLTQVAHLGMSQRLAVKLMPETEVRLSSREVAVLRWTADGKTSGEVSDILDISERTVNFHIGNAMVKLNVANKTAATVRAALLGLLF